MKKHKHLVTLLTSSNIEALERLVYNIESEVEPAENLDTDFIIVVNTLKDDYYQEVLSKNFPLEVVRTESIGTAAKGKNTCHELMLERGYDFLTQFDGDDIFYPTFLLSLGEHVRRMPMLDALGIIPCDVMNRGDLGPGGHQFRPYKDWQASVWGISLTQIGADRRGVARHPYLWDAQTQVHSQDFMILQSRKACSIMYDEDMICAEDHLQSFKYLGQHQAGNLVYYQTMSSDMYLIDRYSPGSVQKENHSFDYTARLKERVPNYVPEWRSSFDELPCFFIDIRMTHTDKEQWLSKFLTDFYESRK